jgi:hypothetical protein
LRKKVTQGRETKAAMTNLRCSSNKQGCMHTLTRMFVQSMYDLKKNWITTLPQQMRVILNHGTMLFTWANLWKCGQSWITWPRLSNVYNFMATQDTL